MPRDPNDDITADFDFGDPALNDPDYESNVDNADVTTDTPADSAPPSANDSVPPPTSDNVIAPTGAGAPAQPVAGTNAQPQGGKPGDRGAVRADDKGNLVDAQGRVIATAGAERRYYERVQMQQKHITRLERELTEAKSSATMIGALNDTPNKLGLTAQDTDLGLQFVAAYKRDPVAAARWALQETMRKGYNLAQIVGADNKGQPLSGSMDLGAVKAMISEAVAPLVGDRAAAAREAEQHATAQREYEAFIAKHQDAAVHDDVLANMLRDDRSLTAETAYWQLYAYAAQNQLDFTQPLRAQVLARQQGQQAAPANGNARPAQAQHQGYMPMPNGSNPAADMRSDPEMAAPDESWDTIVQQSLRAAGFH